MNTEIAQSRSNGYGELPSAFVRLARPLVVEFTSLNQKSFS